MSIQTPVYIDHVTVLECSWRIAPTEANSYPQRGLLEHRRDVMRRDPLHFVLNEITFTLPVRQENRKPVCPSLLLCNPGWCWLISATAAVNCSVSIPVCRLKLWHICASFLFNGQPFWFMAQNTETCLYSQYDVTIPARKWTNGKSVK